MNVVVDAPNSETAEPVAVWEVTDVDIDEQRQKVEGQILVLVLERKKYQSDSTKCIIKSTRGGKEGVTLRRSSITPERRLPLALVYQCTLAYLK